jgi:hypothetical protein
MKLIAGLQIVIGHLGELAIGGLWRFDHVILARVLTNLIVDVERPLWSGEQG